VQVYAWLLSATANPPVVTKTYDVDVPVGQAAHKKIAYVNPWDKPRFYKVLSSNDAVMKPRYDRLEIPPQERAYVRVCELGALLSDVAP
jgi:nephrocystin-4